MTTPGGTPAVDDGTAPDPTAVMGRRVIAKIIDETLRGIPSVIAVVLLLRSARTVAVVDATDYCDRVRTVGHLCVPIGLDRAWDLHMPSLWWGVAGWGMWLVFTWTEGRFGWTPGKLATQIRVVSDSTGTPCGFGRSLIRNLLWIVDSLVFGAVALVLAFTRPGHRRLGDTAASTVVVARSAFGTPPRIPQVPRSIPPMGGPLLPPQTVWDPTRNTWVLWDPGIRAWMAWNPAENRWEPLGG
ncbi:MAG: RDD family protein [Actinobacteria bacterium]|nr:RDD family protein [Actinomycetota bacterium]